MLVVEDNENDFLIVQGYLEEASIFGYSVAPVVRWAAGYEEGLAALLDYEFDVVLLDHGMPPYDGFEFLDEALRIGNKAPVIMLTGRPDPDLDVAALQRGSADFLEKGSLSAGTLNRTIRHSLERQRIAEQLRLADAENRRIWESARCLFMTTDVTQRSGVLVWEADIRNVDMAQQILPLEIPEGSTYAKAFYFARLDEDRYPTSAVAEAAVLACRSDFQFEYRVRNSQGDIRWLSEDTKIEVLGVGKWRLTGVCLDITERKRSDEAVSHAERRMTAIVRNALDAIIVINQAGNVVEFNPAAEDMFGYLREVAVGASLAELIIPSAQRATHLSGLAFYLESGEGPVINNRLELIAMRSDRTEFPVELAVTAVRLGAEVFFIGFVRDITGRVLAETQIRAQAKRLEAERARLAYAQSLAGVGSWSFDLETQVMSVSDELYRIAGFEPNGFAANWTRLLDCVHVDDRSLVSSETLFESGEANPPSDRVVRIRRPDGELRYTLSRTRAICGPDGERVRVEGTMADITDRKNAEVTLDRFFTMSLDMLAIASSDGFFKRVNTAFETTLGFSTAELLAQPFLTFVHPEDRARTLEVVRELVIGQPVAGFVNRYLHRNGGYRWLRWMVTPFGDQYYSVAHDITPLREAEESLRDANEALEQRVADRVAELQQAKQLADRANLAKSEFLSRMSHELRTPLNAILGFGQVLERQSLGPINEESVKYILKGGRHLLHLINEVLDLARVESGHIEVSIEPIEVGPLLRECVDLARTLAEERHVRMNLIDDKQTAHVVLADQRRLKQVFLNLLSNGIKYNSAGGNVTIECRATLDARIRTEIKDSGKGIRPEDLPKLFTPFERLDADNTAIEGTGLGLSLSHRLVSLMAGHIEVESTPGVGSTFSVILPQATVVAAAELNANLAALPPDPSGANNAKSTVLCIEDNPLNLRLFETIFLSRPNITLITATHGLAGLDIAARIRPQLVLLDLNLPDTSGLQILKEMRRMGELAEIPIIVVSSDATKSQIANLLAAGADRYLTKPVDVAELLRMVDEVLESQNSGENNDGS